MMKRMLALAIAGLAASANALAGNQLPAVKVQEPRPLRAIHTARYNQYSWSYRRGPGWTVAQVKRMAKKRRNQIKNRRANRKSA